MQEDLATLFSRNLSLSQAAVTPDLGLERSSTPESHEQAKPPEQPSRIIYSITRHYHHSAHLASSAPSTATAFTFAQNAGSPGQTSAETFLSQHGIDPGLLSSPQIVMFQQADTREQLRLIDKWTASGLYGFAPGLGASPSISAQTEEQISPVQSPSTTLDGLRMWHDQTFAMTKSKASDPRLSTTSEDFTSFNDTTDDVAEPYVITGYDSLAQRDYELQIEMLRQKEPTKQLYSPLGSAVGGSVSQAGSSRPYLAATDPVFQAQSASWLRHIGQAQPHQEMSMDMACQYGAYDQMTRFGDRQQMTNDAVTMDTHSMDDPEDEEML